MREDRGDRRSIIREKYGVASGAGMVANDAETSIEMLRDIGAGRATARESTESESRRAREEDWAQAPSHVAQSKRQWIAVRRLVGPTLVSRCLCLHSLLCVLLLRAASTSALLYRTLYPSITRSSSRSAALLDVGCDVCKIKSVRSSLPSPANGVQPLVCCLVLISLSLGTDVSSARTRLKLPAFSAHWVISPICQRGTTVSSPSIWLILSITASHTALLQR